MLHGVIGIGHDALIKHLLAHRRGLKDHLARPVDDLGNDVRIGGEASGGKGGVRRRHIQRARGGTAKHIGQGGLQAPGALGKASADGDVHGLVRANIGIDLDVDRVDGRPQGGRQINVAPTGSAKVTYRAVIPWDGLGGVAVVDGAQADTGFQGGHQGERLKRGTALSNVLSHGVALNLDIVGASVHAGDGARVGIHGDGCNAQVGRVVLGHRGHTGHHGRLGVVVDGADDRVARGLNLFLSDARLGFHLVQHGPQDVPVGPAVDVEVLVLDGLGEEHERTFVVRHKAQFHHAVQHVVPAEAGLSLVKARVPARRGGEQAGEHGGFGRGEFRGSLAVVGLGRRLDAVRATAKVDSVDVVAQDLALVLLVVDLERHQSLVDLAAQACSGLTHVIPLHILLRDGGTTLLIAQYDGAEHGTGSTADIHAWVRVERAVFSGHECVGHVVGERIDVHDGAVGLTQGTHGCHAVRVVNSRGLIQSEVSWLQNLEGGVPDQQTDDADDGHAESSDERSHTDAAQPELPPWGVICGVDALLARGGALLT